MDSSESQICDKLVPSAFDRNSHQLQIYKYQPLLSKDQIRLLQIINWAPYWAAERVEGSASRPPQYDIINVKLEDCPAYQPVSYVWGPPETTHYIYIGEKDILPLTESLANALPWLVKGCNTGYLWIDQICINQADIQEKSQQVGLMDRIYADTDCLIWAGNHIPNLKNAIYLTSCEQYVEDFPGLARRSKTVGYDSIDCDETTKQPCLELLGRPWFTRAWVVQEAALASSNTLLVGQDRIPLMKFCRALAKIQHHYEAEPVINSQNAVSLSIILEIKALRMPALPASNRPHLRRCHSFLNQVAKCRTSEPRDRIYAFLSILPHPKVFIKPDYTISVAEVFSNLARSIILCSMCLDLFELLPQFDTGRSQILDDIDYLSDNFEGLEYKKEIAVNKVLDCRLINGVQLPSWVPNWNLSKPKPIGSEWDHVGRSYPSKKISGSTWHELGVAGVPITRIKHKIFTAREWLHDIRQLRDNFLSQIHTLHLWPSFSQFLSRINLRVDASAEASDQECDFNLKKNIIFLEFMFHLSDLEPVWGEYLEVLDDEGGWRLDSGSILKSFLGRLPGDHDLVYGEDGQVALSPLCCAKGDIIALIRGSKFPVVLRQQIFQIHTVIGQCLHEGISRKPGDSPIPDGSHGFWNGMFDKEEELFILI